ncbi:uncharacterized protein LOC111390093 [Olea europaea var. sylvestris]|uniref:uncharacterized protein LOC111390093 n=1 Tax=Olea europaea var. sylvestris TaxID=158386 RepID=UPI000C1CDF7F|nr:uncharacterized protein LOC111390093 [Olea europaea var. sylvestris]
MTDIGLMAYYLGIEVKQIEDCIFISQGGYVKEIQYEGLQAYILFGVGLISRYMETPTMTHMKIAKRIVRYIKGTLDYGLVYSSSNEFKLVGYSDSDWGRDGDDRQNTTGYVFYLGDTTFIWSSKKQSIIALSTREAEYVATTSSVCHAI